MKEYFSINIWQRSSQQRKGGGEAVGARVELEWRAGGKTWRWGQSLNGSEEEWRTGGGSEEGSERRSGIRVRAKRAQGLRFGGRTDWEGASECSG